MIRLPGSRLAIAAALSAGLSGCLQPVYGPGAGGAGVAAQLADIAVDRVEGYLGYILKAELDFLLTGGKTPTKAGRYALKVKTQQAQATSVVDTSTGRAQIATLQVEAVYVLLDQTAGGKIKASGKTFASASYDRSQLRFSNVRAERDAEERVAKSLAERLRIIMTTALARDGVSGPPKVPDLSPPAPEDRPGELSAEN